MTTTEQVAAEVLAEHATYDSRVDDDRSDESAVFWQYRCKCGRLLPTGGFADQKHRAHVASVLAARLDDGLAAKVLELADEIGRTRENFTETSLHRRLIDQHVRAIRALLDQPHTGTNP